MIDLTIQISEFLNYCCNRKALNEKTIKAYSVDLKQFSQFTSSTYSKNEICNYISHLHSTFKPKTVRRKIATLKAFTHYRIPTAYNRIPTAHYIKTIPTLRALGVGIIT